MARPQDIANGQLADANKLMQWFNYLADGNGISCGAFADKGTPDDYRLYWAADIKQLLFYTQDASIGDNGWIVISGG